jgi:DNA-binding transcriptional ArsR family regulator
MIPLVPAHESELEIDDPSVLAALYDPLRYRLFRLLERPRSVAELAAEIGLPANRLYYHVRRLLDCGLVIQVDARPAGRQTERVYGRAAGRIRFSGDVAVYTGGFLSGIADELDAGLQSVVDDGPGNVSYHTVSLTPARARELEERLRDLIAEYTEADPADEGATRYGVLGVLAPLPVRGEA